jgi:hypothetical protein
MMMMMMGQLGRLPRAGQVASTTKQVLLLVIEHCRNKTSRFLVENIVETNTHIGV